MVNFNDIFGSTTYYKKNEDGSSSQTVDPGLLGSLYQPITYTRTPADSGAAYSSGNLYGFPALDALRQGAPGTTSPEPTIGEAMGSSGTGGVDYNAQLNALRSQAEALRGQVSDFYANKNQGSSFNAPLLQESSNYESPYLTSRDEERIRRQQMKLMQAEINATNQVYDQMMKQARMQGEGRLGSERAMAARGGLLGSDFAAANKQNVVDFNNDVLSGIQAERIAAIAAIEGKGRKSAVDEINRLNAQRMADYEAKQAARLEAFGVRGANVAAIAEALIAQGVDPEDIPDRLAALSGEIGTDPETIRAEYAKVLASQEQESKAGTVYSTSSGLVRVTPDGKAELIYGTGGGAGGSSSTKFTATQLNKLEEAGLLDAPREEQLSYLFGEDDESSSFNTARQFIADNPNATPAQIRAALFEMTDLGVSEVNALIEEGGIFDEELRLSPDQMTTVASQIRKGMAQFGLSTEEELIKAKDYVQRGVIKVAGKDYRLTKAQIDSLTAALDNLGPRTWLQSTLPGGQ